VAEKHRDAQALALAVQQLRASRTPQDNQAPAVLTALMDPKGNQ
jgi:hypothetical protein